MGPELTASLTAVLGAVATALTMWARQKFVDRARDSEGRDSEAIRREVRSEEALAGIVRVLDEGQQFWESMLRSQERLVDMQEKLLGSHEKLAEQIAAHSSRSREAVVRLGDTVARVEAKLGRP